MKQLVEGAVNIFGKRKPTGRKPYRKKDPKTVEAERGLQEKKWQWDKFVEQMEKNPELEKQYVLKKMDIIEPEPDPSKQEKLEIKKVLIQEAHKLINEDEGLRRQYAEGVLGELIGEKIDKEGHYPFEYGGQQVSSIGQALDDIDGLSQMKEKLTELGIIKGDNGFFSGFSMSELLSAIPYVAAMMGKGAPIDNGSQQEKTYIVRVNGADQELPESQYRQLVRTGKVRPVGEIAAPKVTQQPEQEQEEPAQEEPDVKELPEILSGVDFDRLAECIDNLSPQDFVDQLIRESSEELEESRFLLGFFSTATYDNVVSLITPYKGNLEVDTLIDKILTDEGKTWLEEVIAIIQREEEEE